ncbi:MAG: sarcosine oxidase subunit alpha family protein, partial [Rhodobiaceae bacterium]|nr:sarcosine oxidase subunit alpha family protein [Rhodobiaceae bacterium]
RYTTLGMAADQGKTSNVTGLALMAEARKAGIAEVGSTRFRPPFAPVSLGALAGHETGRHFAPLRRSPIESWHRAHGGAMTMAGLWERPRAYLHEGESVTEAYVREATAVREHVGIVDVSTLGKIDVQGPDAAEFLDRVYSNGFARLPVGKARYGLMLREDGIVFDDGTTWRLSETQFLMTTTTANAGPVLAHLEQCLDVLWPDLRVALASVSDQWAGVAVAGPKSRDLLKWMIESIDFTNESFPFMGVRRGTLDGEEVLVARLSFSGEMAYEVYIGTHFGLHLWERLLSAGRLLGVVPYGVEALGTLRIEKGHVAGGELDGRTTVDDLGLGRMVSTKKDFIGSRMTNRPGLTHDKRLQLVGVRSLNDRPFRIGSHIVTEEFPAEPAESLGHITAYTWSPAIKAHIGLALVENGRDRIGQMLYATNPLKAEHGPVKLVDPCFFDKEGSRMHG